MKNDVALWSGVSAFFASLIAVGVVDIFSLERWVEFASTIFIAGITAGGVYAKQRLDDAKASREGKA